MNAPLLLAAALGVPLALLLACAARAARTRMLAWLWLAPLPALAAALLAVDGAPLVVGTAHLRLAFALDAPAAVLLGAAALLWCAAGAYAATYMRAAPHGGRFAVCWLMTLAGCVGVFLSADLVGFYTLLALMTLGATGLVVHDETAPAWRAAGVYFGLALFAEALVLLGFLLLAAELPAGLLLRDVPTVLAASPRRAAMLALLAGGFAMKAGLAPLHIWIPLAHGAAPMPASAVLSGVVVKVGILGLIRFLPAGAVPEDWGVALAAAGLGAALYAAAIGVTQAQPKVVLAYSTASQMGVVIAVLGMGLAHGDTDTPLAAAFYAAHHVLVKGALFLAVGVVAVTGARRQPAVLWPAALLAVGIGGLPLTGGMLAKLAVKAELGAGLAGQLSILSAIASTALMLHFVRRVAATASAEPDATAPAGLAAPWLAMAAAALLVPWGLWLWLPLGTLAEVLAAGELWKASWPVLLGGGAALALGRWGERLPRLPAGDVAVVLDGGRAAAAAGARAMQRLDGVLRQWPAATLVLAALVLLLGAALQVP